MLGKLLKYDFRALSRSMVPLQAGVLIAGVLGCLLMNFSINSLVNSISYSYNYSGVPFESIISSISMMAITLIFTGVFASSLVTLLLLGHHIYRSFVKDEAYLAFTLPVTPTQHLWSKIICGFVWLVINVLVIFAVTALMTVIGFPIDGGFVNYEVLSVYGEIFTWLFSPMGVLIIIELLVLMLAGCFVSVIEIYASVILGGAVAKTHKVLAAVGIYLLIGTITGIIASIVMTFGTMFYVEMFSSYSYSYSLTDWEIFGLFQPVLIGSLICTIIVGVVLYILSRSSLKNNLNLE